MNLKIGIVGLPNVGKSTLFNALLKSQQALAANYPFATIEPNIGVATVPNPKLPILADLVHTTTIKPATIEFVDIAGLVKGASQGEGLGNQFLSHIRSTHAIAHVLRVFTNPDIIRDQPLDPLADLQTIRLELQLADLDILQRQTPPKGKVSPTDQARFATITAFIHTLEQDQNISTYLDTLDPDTRTQATTLAQQLSLLTHKPELFVLNVDETDLARTDQLISTWTDKLSVSPDQIIVVSAQIESELALLSPDEQQIFLRELGITQSGLDRLATVAYRTLHLQSFLTAGTLEVKAWTIPQGTTALQAAGTIHTDFLRQFIKAKVITYDDFVQAGGWKPAANAGQIRLEGKDYLMQPDDIVEFVLNSK